MKKNRMMRAASALLVAVLLTTCTISGTFAKYTTSVDSQDTARVAKWGFTATSMNITDLFDKAYDESATDKTVESEVDVIAPGTTNSASFSFVYSEGVANAPEVAYTFTVSTAGSSIAADIKNNGNIKWKLDNGTWGTWDELIAAIEALDNNPTPVTGKADNYYAPGTLPAGFTKNDDVHTVSWKWAFDDNDDTDFTASDLDTTDTAMGNGSVDALAVTLKITITATQVD